MYWHVSCRCFAVMDHARVQLDVPVGFGHTTVTTKSGRVVTIRHLVVGDAPLLAALFASLSPSSRYLRFFTPRGIPDELLSGESMRLSDIDHCMHVALIVTTPVEGGEMAIAEARLIHDDDEVGQAEFAIAVRDDWQHESIGTMLFDLLIQVGLVHGIERVYAIVLRQNRGMRRLVQSLGLSYAIQNEGSEAIYWIALVGDQPLPGSRRKPGVA